MATQRFPGHIHITRKEPQPMESLLGRCIRSMGLTPGINTRRIFAAWDEASGSGTLYITVRSSVIRSQLYFQRDLLIEKINTILRTDAMFDPTSQTVGFVKNIVLK